MRLTYVPYGWLFHKYFPHSATSLHLNSYNPDNPCHCQIILRWQYKLPNCYICIYLCPLQSILNTVFRALISFDIYNGPKSLHVLLRLIFLNSCPIFFLTHLVPVTESKLQHHVSDRFYHLLYSYFLLSTVTCRHNNHLTYAVFHFLIRMWAS